MKKIFFYIASFLLLTTSIIIFSSCFSEKPGKAAKESVTYLYQKDYDKFVENLAFPDDSIQGRREENAKAVKDLLTEFEGKEGFDEFVMDSIQSINVLSEEIHQDKTTADVSLEVILKNGKADTNSYVMVKRDGKWKMYNEK